MLIGTHRWRIKIRHLKPEYPFIGVLEWVFDAVVMAAVFLLVFGSVYFFLEYAV